MIDMADLVQSQDHVTKSCMRTVDRMSSVGVFSALKQSNYFEEKKGDMANFFASIIEEKMNADFHDQLSLLEKAGFISNEKIARHQKNVSFGKLASNLTVNLGVDAVLIGIQVCQENKKFNEYADFLSASLLHVNGDSSLQIRSRLEKLYQQSGKKFKSDIIKLASDKYIGARAEILPSVPFHIEGTSENLFHTIATTVDTSDTLVKDRLFNVGSLLNLSNDSMQGIYTSAHDSIGFNSSVVEFSSLSMSSIFQSFFKNIELSKAASLCNVENDYYAHVRHSRKQIITNGALIASTAALTAVTGPLGDAVLVAGLPMVLKFVNSEDSTDVLFNLHNKINEERSNRKIATSAS